MRNAMAAEQEQRGSPLLWTGRHYFSQDTPLRLGLVLLSGLRRQQLPWIEEHSYLIALGFLLTPLQQGVPLGPPIFSCQGRQRILPFFPAKWREETFQLVFLIRAPFQARNPTEQTEHLNRTHAPSEADNSQRHLHASDSSVNFYRPHRPTAVGGSAAEGRPCHHPQGSRVQGQRNVARDTWSAAATPAACKSRHGSFPLSLRLPCCYVSSHATSMSSVTSPSF